MKDIKNEGSKEQDLKDFYSRICQAFVKDTREQRPWDTCSQGGRALEGTECKAHWCVSK